MKVENGTIDNTGPDADNGRILFYTGTTPEFESSEVLRFEPNGDIFVRGKLAANDLEVVDGIRDWFAAATWKSPPRRWPGSTLSVVSPPRCPMRIVVTPSHAAWVPTSRKRKRSGPPSFGTYTYRTLRDWHRRLMGDCA